MMEPLQTRQTTEWTTVSERLSSVALPNGVTLPFIEQGDPEGLPVLLVHGYTDSWRSWETVLPHLPKTLHVFAVTQRGHGDASRPATGYRVDDFVKDLAAFIDALEIGPAIIAGHSLGSAIAQRYAMTHPERTLGLVLVGATTTWRGNPVIAEFWESAVSALTDPIAADFVRAFQGSPRMSPERLEAAVAESLALPAHIWREVFQGIMDADFSAELNNIQAPTLIVWGDQDLLCPRAEQDALTAAIVGSRLAVYAGGGHNLHWEEPQRFAADLTAFCAELIV
jgi:pimeloyl-ACP methyl ester carboxylesterase